VSLEAFVFGLLAIACAPLPVFPADDHLAKRVNLWDASGHHEDGFL